MFHEDRDHHACSALAKDWSKYLMNEYMNWRAGRTTLPLRLGERKQIVKAQSLLEVKSHSAFITSTFPRTNSTVARGNNSG